MLKVFLVTFVLQISGESGYMPTLEFKDLKLCQEASLNLKKFKPQGVADVQSRCLTITFKKDKGTSI